MPVVLDQEFVPDTHGVLAEWRAKSPAIAMQDGRIIVLRAEDVIRLTTDPRTMQIPGVAYANHHRIPEGRARKFLEDMLLFSNGEAHVLRRGPFARAFAFSAIKARRPAIRAVARQVMAEMPRGEEFNFVDRVAARVPSEMIAGLLGLPVSDAPYFSSLVYKLARTLSTNYPMEMHDEIETAANELYAYLGGQLAERQTAPRDDMLTGLLETVDELGEEDTLTQLMAVVLAGTDTTRAAFAIMVMLLLQDGQAWTDVRDDRGLIPGALSEALRCEPSVGALPRLTAAALELGDFTVPPGRILVLSSVSAMRDPALYAEPNRFDIRRTDHPKLHLVFGGGVHRCLGEMLARIEMEEALDALLDAAPDLQLVEAPQILGLGGIRGVTPMTVLAP
ncbi:cytochrome P450 [Pseudoruegeria sp. HB172150]|uniref:cytochrome P450 n=1 Tax=Pseudoruegeria sp. HB172150 TaxID=2721164 RepID=UPI001C132A0F|nr:cytochrome P450 [Pseudoruegeria sp. HB172150]